MRESDFPKVHFGTGPGPRSKSCNICLTDIQPLEASVTHTTCQNSFHRSCFSDWFDNQSAQRRSTTCPMCREPLNQVNQREPELTEYEMYNGLARFEVELVSLPPILVISPRDSTWYRTDRLPHNESVQRNEQQPLSHSDSPHRTTSMRWTGDHAYSAADRMEYLDPIRGSEVPHLEVPDFPYSPAWRRQLERSGIWDNLYELERTEQSRQR